MLVPDPSAPEAKVTAEGPANCCTVDVDPRIRHHFDGNMRRFSERGEWPPLADVSERLLALLADVDMRRPNVLELGCGSGALSVALLSAGASSGEGVDLSPESIGMARRRADEAGVGDRLELRVGDGSQVPLAPRDWVVLDRVMCCYPRIDQLLGNAIPAAMERFAFTVPYPLGWRGVVLRAIVGVENVLDRFRRAPCPAYIHDLSRIEGRLSAAGFRRRASELVGLWYAAVWERDSVPALA